MRVLLKKDFTIDLLSVDKVINVNDVMVSRLEVEVEENLLLPGERLWVVFSKTKDNPTDDITKEIQLSTDNKTYSVAIPQAVVMQEGKWYFILSARKYYSNEKYFTRKATAPYEFTVEGGLWIDEGTSEVVNNGTAQSLYEMATDKLAIEQGNAEAIAELEPKVEDQGNEIKVHEKEITDIQAYIPVVDDIANEALLKAKTAQQDLDYIKNDVDNLKQSAASNLIAGNGKGAVQQVADGVADGFDFTDKNATATAKDPSLTGMLPYGAVGNYSSAFGGKSMASGKRSHTEGTTTVAKGDYSHAEGNNSVTLGANSHAEGKQTTTLGENAHAEGFDTFAEGYISHSEGYKTHAQGACSHAEGNGTEAIQDQAHAEGSQTHALGYASHSEGEGTFAENHACHAEGKDSQAKGYCSHSEGISTYAIGMYSHAQGGWTYANGDYSVASGNDSIADYHCDFVHGEGLRTTYEHQTVFGKYNDASNWGNNRPLFMIGNGYKDESGVEHRSNAFEVRENGEVYAGGKLLQGGAAGGGTKWYRHTYVTDVNTKVIIVTTRATAYITVNEVLIDWANCNILGAYDETVAGRAEKIEKSNNTLMFPSEGSVGYGLNLDTATLENIEEL